MIRFCAVAALALLASPAFADDIPARDHTVTVTSTVPAIAGQKSKLYVRERALPQVLKHGAGDKVVLFVHGAGTPAEVSFDVPYQDYSWMGYLAAAGYDVFSVDMTGYGRSARPKQMDDKCNLSPEQQKDLRRQLPAKLSRQPDQYRIRLERYFRGGRLHPEAAPCEEAQSDRLVARRPARRRLDRRPSRPGGQADPAGAGL